MTQPQLVDNPHKYPVRTGRELRKGGPSGYLKPGDQIAFTHTSYAIHLLNRVITIASTKDAESFDGRRRYIWDQYPEGTFIAKEHENSDRKMCWMIEDSWTFYVIPRTRKIGVFQD